MSLVGGAPGILGTIEARRKSFDVNRLVAGVEAPLHRFGLQVHIHGVAFRYICGHYRFD